MDCEKLKAPFDPSVVSWRVGSTNGEKTKGLALAYIDARDVMKRLDEVCGPEGWQDRYEFHGARTVCYLSIINADGSWITKADGAGDSDVEAEKGSISDAFKRAAVKWGIGRYLYDLDAPWVEIEAMGRSFKIKKAEYAKLEAILARKVGVVAPPANAPPPAPAKAPLTNAQKTYIATFQLAIERCESALEVGEIWEREQPNRAALKITRNSIAADQLLAMRDKQLKAIEALEARPPATVTP